MIELPPCPICGAKAFLQADVIDDSFFMGYSVGCPRYALYDGIHGHDENTPPEDRLTFFGFPTKEAAVKAHQKGIKTWVSFEPVLNAENVLGMIKDVAPYVDKVKIGKLNYHLSDIDWARFGREAEALCKSLGLDYYIKDSLRAEMEKA